MRRTCESNDEKLAIILFHHSTLSCPYHTIPNFLFSLYRHRSNCSIKSDSFCRSQQRSRSPRQRSTSRDRKRRSRKQVYVHRAVCQCRWGYHLWRYRTMASLATNPMEQEQQRFTIVDLCRKVIRLILVERTMHWIRGDPEKGILGHPSASASIQTINLALQTKSPINRLKGKEGSAEVKEDSVTSDSKTRETETFLKSE